MMDSQERESLLVQLDKAIELTEDALPYVPSYFRWKWNMDERMKELMEFVETVRILKRKLEDR